MVSYIDSEYIGNQKKENNLILTLKYAAPIEKTTNKYILLKLYLCLSEGCVYIFQVKDYYFEKEPK